jgi:LmbE family N-acetylglucosaminyl deacetylase
MIDLVLGGGSLDVLCLGAHPDDVEIGCGATLLSLSKAKAVRATVALLTGTPSRRAEAEASARRFLPGAQVEVRASDLPDGRLPAHWDAVKQTLEDLAATIRPHVVFAPRRDDAHQDHRLIAELTATVWRDALVLHYEIPKWDGDLHPVTHYVPLTREQAVTKTRLLDEAYPSQHGHDWWDEETFLGLLRLRGVECRSRYAEGFVSPKTVLGFA